MSSTALTVRHGKEITYSEMLDGSRRYVTDTPTPARLATLLKDIDQGDIAAMTEIATEIEGKDPDLQSLASRRRQAVTGLDWRVEAADAEDRTAVEAAEYVDDRLRHIRTWPETLEHLSTALGPGVAVSELVWHRGEIVETNDVPGHRLIGAPTNPNSIGIETDDDIVEGVPAQEGKFIVYTPNCRAGFPLHVTLTRASIWPWIIKHHGLSDWVAFSEVFGMPFKQWTYADGTTTAEIEALKVMAEQLGPDSYAVTHENVKLVMNESAKGDHPGQALNEWADKKLAILWLGQTLTTDTQGVGSLALGQVHENVAAFIARSDIKTEKRMIERYVIDPMIRLRFPGKIIQTPEWNRITFETRDLDAERLNMEQVRTAREFGLAVDNDVLYEKLNLPEPKDQVPPTVA